MKRKFQILILLSGMVLLARPTFSQYTGGSSDGYVSSRSDDILYEGSTPVVTGPELPDVVHNLTIDNSGGVTLSKGIIVTGTLKIIRGILNLNGNTILLGEQATVIEVPGNLATGIVGKLSVTRVLNDLASGRNIAGIGLKIKTIVPLGETIIERGHTPQPLTPIMMSTNRFFDVDPTNNANLNAEVEFHYDESELNGIPEADLALFKSKDAAFTSISSSNTVQKALAASPTWQFLGGTVEPQANTVCKGGVGDFSRLAIGRAFVFLVNDSMKIDDNIISEGDIHSNGTILFKTGEPGTHTGNLTAVSDITIKRDNTIVGNVVTGENLILLDNATVTGTTSDHTIITPIGLPTPSFTAGGPDTTVPRDQSLTLPPGSYGEVEIKKRGTLFLRTGDYFMDALSTNRGSMISIDVAAGPVNINVVTELEFDDGVEIIITPSGQVSTNQVTFTTLQTEKMEIGRHALILGWLIAPNAAVHFSEESQFKGSAVARAIVAEDEVKFISHSSSTVLPKPVFVDEEDESAEEITAMAKDYELTQNYPNPFWSAATSPARSGGNLSTTIHFSLKEAGTVQLSIYNIQGQEVRTLISSHMNPGQHTVNWDGRDNRGQLVPSGVYLYRLSVHGMVQTKKMTFMK
jgi:hypothetical protein